MYFTKSLEACMERQILGIWSSLHNIDVILIVQFSSSMPRGVSALPIPCDKGSFGPECIGVCHCLSGKNLCRTEDGRCTDMRCSHGWTNPPLCQTG